MNGSFLHDPESHQTQMCSARKSCLRDGMDHGAVAVAMIAIPFAVHAIAHHNIACNEIKPFFHAIFFPHSLVLLIST